jgi:hypothetical protein
MAYLHGSTLTDKLLDIQTDKTLIGAQDRGRIAHRLRGKFAAEIQRLASYPHRPQPPEL